MSRSATDVERQILHEGLGQRHVDEVARRFADRAVLEVFATPTTSSGRSDSPPPGCAELTQDVLTHGVTPGPQALGQDLVDDDHALRTPGGPPR